LFQAAGIKKSELKDAETAKFLINTITQNLPAAPPAPPKRTGPAPPPPTAVRSAAPPPPGTRGNAPPPPPGTRGNAPPPPPSGASVPPPPPPPGAPMMRSGNAPAPPPPAAAPSYENYDAPEEDDGNAGDTRSGLLAQIRQGTSLKKADERVVSELPELDQQTSDNLATILASAMAARRVDMKLKPAPGEENDGGDDDGWSD